MIAPAQASLFASTSPVYDIADVADWLDRDHYLGAARRGWAWCSDEGVMVFANPNSRRLPQSSWLELIRWCLRGEKNDGSRQWAAFARWARINLPDITTVVSYSDPSVGHTGALYRACNWKWAPTWHRLRPPPTGNGDWGSGQQATKDRWVFPLRPDSLRSDLLLVRDDSILRRAPWLAYDDAKGVDFKRWTSRSASILENAPGPQTESQK